MAKGGIVIVTGDSDRHGYFTHQLIAAGLPVAGVITGAKKRPAAASRTRQPGPEQRVALRQVKRQRLEAEQEFFGGQCEILNRLPAQIWREHVTGADQTINHTRFLQLLSAAAPSHVAVMGASIIRPPLLGLPLRWLNMHTGLSPYYRGGRTNMWPVIEKEFGYFGVTVHEITPGVDDGPIYRSARLLVEPADNYALINARAIVKGTQLMAETLSDLMQKPDWPGVPQWCAGKLFLDRHFTGEIAQAYIDNYPNYMRRHLLLQDMGRLDEVRTIDAPQ